MHTRPWWWWRRVSALVGLVLSDWTHVMAATPEDWGPWGGHMMWNTWGIGMMLMMLLFWVVLIVGSVVLIRWLVTSRHGGGSLDASPHAESALDILNKRYARGEITKPEFEAMRQDLQARV